MSKKNVPGYCGLRPHSFIVLLLSLLTIIVFWRSLSNGFVNYDDDVYVYENPHIQQGMTCNDIRWAFTSFYEANWHPLTWLSHMLDYRVFGLDPRGHHFINLLLHLLNVLLLFRLFEGMTGELCKSAIVAMLFAVHPLHVESVAWIAERKDLLCAFWSLLTLIAYHGYCCREKQIARYSLTILLFTFALMSKPMAVTLPLLMLLLDFWPLKRFTKSSSFEKIPFFALSAVSSLLTVMAQNQGKAVMSLAQDPFSHRLTNALAGYFVYIRKMFFPQNLAVFYPRSGAAFSSVEILVAAFFLLFVTIAAVKMRQKRPYFLFGWLWYIVMLIPVIGLVQVGNQAFADRYTYLSLVGLFVILTWFAGDTAGRTACMKSLLKSFVAIIVMMYMLLSWNQLGYWKNGSTLFSYAASATNNNYVAHAKLGEYFFRIGDNKQAAQHLFQALQYQTRLANVYNLLGIIRGSQGNNKDAEFFYTVALSIDPAMARAHYNLGRLFWQEGNINKAIEQFRQAVRLKPDYQSAHDALLKCEKIYEIQNQKRNAID